MIFRQTVGYRAQIITGRRTIASFCTIIYSIEEPVYTGFYYSDRESGQRVYFGGKDKQYTVLSLCMFECCALFVGSRDNIPGTHRELQG